MLYITYKIYMYRHDYINTYINTYIHAYMHNTYMLIYMHTYIHNIHTLHTYMHTHTRTHIQAYIQAYIHAFLYIPTYIGFQYTILYHYCTFSSSSRYLISLCQGSQSTPSLYKYHQMSNTSSHSVSLTKLHFSLHYKSSKCPKYIVLESR